VKRAASFRAVIGASPRCGPADHQAARRYLARVEAALDQGGWTRAERVRLYAAAKKWRARAVGKDARFEVAGTRAGGMTADERAVVALLGTKAGTKARPELGTR
jgi:hypothetical protein